MPVPTVIFKLGELLACGVSEVAAGSEVGLLLALVSEGILIRIPSTEDALEPDMRDSAEGPAITMGG
jgi:hypothetical protein